MLLVAPKCVAHALDLIEAVLCVVDQGLSLDARLSAGHILNKLTLQLAVVGMREKLVVHQNYLSLELLVGGFKGPEFIFKHVHVIAVDFLQVERKDLDLEVDLLGALVITTVSRGLCCTARWDSDCVFLFSDPLLQLVKIGRVEVVCPMHILF